MHNSKLGKLILVNLFYLEIKNGWKLLKIKPVSIKHIFKNSK